MLSYGGTEIPQQLKVNWNGGCCFAIWLAAWLPWSLSELPGRLPATSLATSLPSLPVAPLSEPTPSPAKWVSANVCRILPGFCRQKVAQKWLRSGSELALTLSAGGIWILPGFRRQNLVHLFPLDSTGINPDSAGEERYFHMSAEFCPEHWQLWGR